MSVPPPVDDVIVTSWHPGPPAVFVMLDAPGQTDPETRVAVLRSGRWIVVEGWQARGY